MLLGITYCIDDAYLDGASPRLMDHRFKQAHSDWSGQSDHVAMCTP